MFSTMVTFNPRIIKYGKIVHIVPYVLFLIGAALFVFELGVTSNSLGGLLISGVLILVIHAAAYYEWRKDFGKSGSS